MSEQIACSDQLGEIHTFLRDDFIEREAIYGIAINELGVLLVQDSLSNKWEVPGGGKDSANESDYDCLRREFYEETGLYLGGMLEEVASFTSYFFDLTTQEPWKTKRKFWLVTTLVGEIRENGNNEDVQRVKRIVLDEITRAYIDPEVAQVIGKAISRFSSWPL